MGGMMGQTPTPTTTANSMLPYYGVLFAVIIAVTVVGVIGVAYCTEFIHKSERAPPNNQPL